jgi:heme exporter protein C
VSRSTSTTLFLALVGTTTALLAASLWQIFAVAPVEATMGVVQKIFYFHVPSAYAMYLCATVCFLGSAWFLGTGSRTADALAQAGGEATVAFGLIVLVSGPLWARKAWGTFWTWDPRLTTTLLAMLIYLAYLVLRAFGGEGEAEKRFAAALGILGVADLPIIHWSVQKWAGQHPTVITSRGGGIDPAMKPALLLSFLLFTAIAATLLWLRTRGELLSRRVGELQERAIESGSIDEEDLYS